MKHRLPALDWMRGIVMVLMATDHASGAFNSNRLVTDSPFFYKPDTALPYLDYIYRWVSHLCAPSFLFLAGTALALSITRKEQKGASSSGIDRDLFTRGLIIIAVDLLFVNLFWVPGLMLLQVMYAIGCAMILMIPMRRLGAGWLVLIAVAVLVGSELFLQPELVITGGPTAILSSFLVSVGIVGKVLVGYPVLPWWAMMALGWGFGHYLAGGDGEKSRSACRFMFIAGVVCLAVFGLVRGLNGFGNMELFRLDSSMIQWLHASKYPPSISYVAMELGLMALVLSCLFLIQRSVGDNFSSRNPILVFGQTPFFFYIMHILLFEVSARTLGIYQQNGLIASLAATAVVLAVLYPVCIWYRSYKAAHRGSWLRFI